MQKLTTQNGVEGQKMKILPLGPNSAKFCTHNLWATKKLEIQKLGGCWVGGSLGGVAPWLARGLRNAGLAASIRIYKNGKFQSSTSRNS